MITTIKAEDLRKMQGKEGLILQGCGGDPQEWLDGINEMLTDAKVLIDGTKFSDVSVFEHEGLTNILFPFSKQLEKLARVIVKASDEEKEMILDERLMLTPTIAVGESANFVTKMFTKVRNGLDKATGDKMATDDMKAIFLKCLGDLAIYYYEDSEITKFVFEELEPYFKGDHTLDEAITVLNDRTTKYVREL